MTDIMRIETKAVMKRRMVAVMIIALVITFAGIKVYEIAGDLFKLIGGSDSADTDFDFLHPSSGSACDMAKKEGVDIDTKIIGSRLQNVAKIALIEKDYMERISMEDYKQLWGINVIGTKKSATLEAVVKVEAGIDMGDFGNPEVEAVGRKVYITLPDPEILNVYTDPEEVYVYDETHNIFNQISISDSSAMLAEAEKCAREHAEGDDLKGLVKGDIQEKIEAFMDEMYPDEDIIVKLIWK